MSPKLENIIVLATFSTVWCHAELNSPRLVTGSADENSVTKNNSRHALSAFVPEIPRILHVTTNIILFLNLSILTRSWNSLMYVGLKKKSQFKVMRFLSLPIKGKKKPPKTCSSLSKVLGFLNNIGDMEWGQYAHITDHFNLKPISQFGEGELVMSMIHYSLHTLKLNRLFLVNYSVN